MFLLYRHRAMQLYHAERLHPPKQPVTADVRDASETRKFSCWCREFNAGAFSTYPYKYTDYTTAVQEPNKMSTLYIRYLYITLITVHSVVLITTG
jgi:hypothetical protein